jgi:hypothetical protein
MASTTNGGLQLAESLPADPAAAEATRSRAAGIVESYVQENAVPALDGVLAAAEPSRASGQARAARDAAELVDAEVRRFRALERSG